MSGGCCTVALNQLNKDLEINRSLEGNKIILIGKDANVYTQDKILIGKAKVKNGKLIVVPLT